MNRTFTFLVALLVVSSVFAQSPEKLSYQAVVRDTEKILLVNQEVGMQITVLLGSVDGTPVYTETHTPTTNANGLVTIEIGTGVTSDDFTAIDWSNGTYFVKTETDPSGGTSYTITGTSQLLSVPYSLFSKNAETVTGTISESQISDLQNYLTAETDPVYAGSQAASITAADIVNLSNLSGTNTGDQVIDPAVWKTNGSNTFYNDGYVGIGTSTPDQKLSVHSASGTSYVRVSDNTTGPASGLRMGMSGSGNAYIINDEAAKSLSLGTSGTSQLRISDLGYVGINELTPEMMLHVKQDISNRGIRIEHQSTTDYWDTGIGVTTRNYKFYYNDLFRADISSVDGAYVQSSDRRLKKDIQYMGSVLDKVMKLKPATYYYIDNDVSAPRSKGFVTQDVEDIFPNLVREIGDGYSGIVYDGFAVISIKAIQEMNIGMKEMQTKTNQMQAEIEELKNAIETLKNGN